MESELEKCGPATRALREWELKEKSLYQSKADPSFQKYQSSKRIRKSGEKKVNDALNMSVLLRSIEKVELCSSFPLIEWEFHDEPKSYGFDYMDASLMGLPAKDEEKNNTIEPPLREDVILSNAAEIKQSDLETFEIFQYA
eukprot:CAMPEP_0194254346 /NCGR_PEP_ID=MMETSP0158-20130606/31938_1 /TAXON_ID=33649 /ORGANISM="Thalassionema nitzschioides, Strain L26-B" /LENGTH=140 /DNA_ID=CAMNT_0038992335 /DNA_START=24 /DNA_END=443 /DNA_ORIENTATION=+